MQKKTLNKFLCCAVAIVMVFCSGHAYQTIYPTVLRLIYPSAIFAIFFLLCRKDFFVINKTSIALILFTCMIICTCFVSFGSGLTTYLSLLCFILVSYGITKFYSFTQFVTGYLNIMMGVTLISFIGYFLVQNTNVLDTLPKMTNINGIEYRGSLVFSFIPTTPDRNCGMFWEPGLFATNLIIAITLELLCVEKTSKLRIILFSLAIFTANSSAGFVLWILCMLLMVVKKVNAKTISIGSLVRVGFVFIAVVFILNMDKVISGTALAENEYWSKLLSDNLKDASRTKAIAHNLQIFRLSPIFGVGLSEAFANMKYVADTSTSTFMMSVFGLPGVLYTGYWVYGIVNNVKSNALVKIVLMAIVIFILNKEPHYQNLMTWCFLFYLIDGDVSKVNEKNTAFKDNSQKKLAEG